MAIVDSSLQLGYKNSAWFTANAAIVLLAGQIVYLDDQSGTFKLGDGTTDLATLTFLGGSGGGGTQNLQGVIDESPTVDGVVFQSLDGNTTVTVNNDLVSISSVDGLGNTAQVDVSSSSISILSSDGVDSSATTISPTTIDFSANSVTKSSSEIATEAYADLKLAIASNLSDLSNPLTARNNLKIFDMFITTGDQSTTSNVASNITGLVTGTLEINKRYYFEGVIHYGCNNTGGVKFQVTLPTGATCNLWLDGVNAASTSRRTDIISASATLSLIFQAYTGITYVRVCGEVLMSSTAGVVQFGFASATNTQTTTAYQIGTNITYKKLD